MAYKAHFDAKKKLVTIEIDVSKDPTPSSTGVMLLYANSGGFDSVEGTPYRFNLNLGVKNPAHVKAPKA